VLIDAKVQPNVTDSAGQSALHYFLGPHGFCADREGPRAAKLATAQKVFTILVNAGADITLKDHEGTTPFGLFLMQYETYFGTKECILGFAAPALAKSLNVNAVRIKDRPALVAVCDRGQCDPALVNRLLELGADPRSAEDDGFTALHGAAWFYNYAVCELLLEHGAPVNAINEKGRTALHELARSKYFDSAFLDSDRAANIVRAADVLLAHGADRRIKDKEGRTAFDLFKNLGGGAAADEDLGRVLRKKLRP
jgi:ankyrin repeat protein